jgi:hypothetical protein
MDADFNFSFSSIFAGIVFSSFGVYFIKQGRKTANLNHIVIGVVLLIFPYFVSNEFLIWSLGSALLFLAYRMR